MYLTYKIAFLLLLSDQFFFFENAKCTIGIFFTTLLKIVWKLKKLLLVTNTNHPYHFLTDFVKLLFGHHKILHKIAKKFQKI